MENKYLDKLETPCYVVDETLLIKNLKVLQSVIKETDCKILLAQKAFSMYYFYPLIGKYISGATASGLFEAKLSYENMTRENQALENHIFSPAYKESEIEEILEICNHIVFNSFEQFKKFKKYTKNTSCGIRINPEYAEVETEIYNPCGDKTRFGIKISEFEKNLDLVNEIDGLHFHTMCEQNSDVLERTLNIFLDKFGKYLYSLKWVNFGGGHHITREDYDIEKLKKLITFVKNEYNVEVYLEPGEAIALNTGFLVSSVLDIREDNIAILDTSAACHMPDVLEMPYRPFIINSGLENEYKYTYRFGGPTCLAGDIIGDYSFREKLSIDDKLVFCDMAHYTMVKNNTFNGINLPSIYVLTTDKEIKLINKFGYSDFKNRL